MAELFIPKNPIETAQEFQWGISIADPEEAPLLAAHAKPIINESEKEYGNARVYVHTLAAFTLNVAGLLQNDFLGQPYDDVLIDGTYVGLEYIQNDGKPQIQSFMLYMHNARILDSSVVATIGEEIAEPILLPVLDVQSLEMAA